MSKFKLPYSNFTKTTTPRQSGFNSPIFSRSQRNTHQSYENLRTQIKKQSDLLSPTSRNFITQKSEILLKVDEKLNEKINRKLTMQKINSKMSILSMQRSKFKISKNKSCFRSHMLSGFNMPILDSTTNQVSSGSHFQSILNRRQAGCYNVTAQIQSFKSYLKIISLNHPKKNKGRKSELLTRRLLDYFINANQVDIKKDLIQIKAIGGQLIKCLSQNTEINLNVLRHVDRDIAKLIFNICYEVYRKKQKGVTHTELIKINKQIQYTSRRLKFLQITLRTCFDLGKIYSDHMQYDNAFRQYTHAVKLSIFMNNKYYEEIAIDKLGISKYYLGDSISSLYFHNNIHHLSEYDLKRIKDEYSNQNQIKRLIEQKKQLKLNEKIRHQRNVLTEIQNDKNKQIDNQSFTVGGRENYQRGNGKYNELKKFNLGKLSNDDNQENQQKIDIGEFNFGKQNREEFYPVINNNQFKKNLKKIIKIPELRPKIHVLKRNLKKNDVIGTKRYCGQNYVIPTASMCSRKQNFAQFNQVCLSHRSYNRNSIQNDTAKIQKDSKTLIMALNYFLNQNYIDKVNNNNIQQYYEDTGHNQGNQ